MVYKLRNGGIMRFGSLFSGIGGFDLGFERAGMECIWQIEIDLKCQEVLEKRFTGVKRYGDITKVTGLEPVDVICGGFPCQDLSVAGKRAGLAGERSGLWYEFLRIIQEVRPQWVVIENVPGLLSSNHGADFAVIVQGLAECGYLSAWGVLDAQYFGVAQRRRRVFVVASLGDGRAAEILFEREGMFGNTPARREAGKGITEVAGTLASSGGGMDRPAGNANELDFCIVAPTIDAEYFSKRYSNQQFFSQNGDGFPIISRPLAYGKTNDHQDESQQTYIATWDKRQITSKENRSQPNAEYTPTLNGNGEMMTGVRRLTPTECARLQGFPDDWNDWLADSTRYRQFGNAVCVPVVEWIGKRIKEAQT
jgi:DNA (cytosine-5)-methyltransferase 1